LEAISQMTKMSPKNRFEKFACLVWNKADYLLLLTIIFFIQSWHWRLFEYLKHNSPPFSSSGDYLWFVGALNQIFNDLSRSIGLDPRQQPESALSIQIPIIVLKAMLNLEMWQAVNLVLFAAPVFTGLLCLFALKKNLSIGFAFLGSLTFALTPFSTARYGHVLLSILWVVPLTYILIVDARKPFMTKWKRFFVTLLIATSSIYYVVFSIITLSIQFLNQRTKRIAQNLISVILISFSAQLIYLLTRPRALNEFHVPTRYPTDSITYGGTLLTLFPAMNNKISEFFAQIQREDHSLGLNGALLVVAAFLILLLNINFKKSKQDSKWKEDTKIFLGIFLFFVKGGFGAFVALVFYQLTSHPIPIRVWSRLAPWLLFFAILIVFQYLESNLRIFQISTAITLVIILATQSLERVTSDFWSVREASFSSRNNEVKKLASNSVSNCKILQLPIDGIPPIMPNPDLGININDVYYSGLQGLVISQDYVWTEGSYPGSREFLKFQRDVLDEKINSLKIGGLKKQNVCAIEVDALKGKYLTVPTIPENYRLIYRDQRYSLYILK
jgi:hypothetical protein